MVQQVNKTRNPKASFSGDPFCWASSISFQCPALVFVDVAAINRLASDMHRQHDDADWRLLSVFAESNKYYCSVEMAHCHTHYHLLTIDKQH